MTLVGARRGGDGDAEGGVVFGVWGEGFCVEGEVFLGEVGGFVVGG